MMLAARGAFLAARRKLTANSYVQDGLIAMWDGIENAGYGVHDSAPTKWKDLVGSRDWTHLPTGITWGEDCVDSTSGIKYVGTESWTVAPVTIEVCGVAYSAMNGCLVFGFGNGKMFGILTSNNRGFQFASNKPTFRADFFTPWTVAATFSGSDIESTYYNAEYKAATAGSSSWGVANRVCFGDSAYFYKGKLFSIRIYNRALTAAEIAANYAVDKARFNLP